MFREMRRFKQQISEEECVRVLRAQPRGVLSMLGDDGYPYGIPLDHWYSEKDNKLYFHCAKVGHKLDAITACDKVSYCVMDEGYRKDGEWALNINSVVVFGRIRIVNDEEKKREICTNLVRKFRTCHELIYPSCLPGFPKLKSESLAGLRSAPVGAKRASTGRTAPPVRLRLSSLFLKNHSAQSE